MNEREINIYFISCYDETHIKNGEKEKFRFQIDDRFCVEIV